MARNDVVRVTHKLPPKKETKEEQIQRLMEERERNTLYIGAPNPRSRPLDEQRTTLPARLVSALPTGASRDAARMVLHGFARTGNTILKAIDIPNRVFGNTRSLLQDIYERSEANLERDAYEDRSGVPQVGETAVHLVSAGVLGRALPAVFGANVGVDTYETAKYAGASEGEALAKGVGHGVVDTAIWTLGQGLASKYLPKAWQWLGREIVGAGRGAASSVTSDAVLNSLGADISGEEMAKRAAHAAWMVPLFGMLKMGGKRREEALVMLRKARPDLAGVKSEKVVETLEGEFADPRSQKIALHWVARKGANLPDDIAQIRQALEVGSKVKGLDLMSKSPYEIIANPAYARYLPKPKPQDVKAFTNMKRYPEGVIGFDVSDDAAGRQATREMINAYMSPSSNPWCLATGKDAAKLGGLGPDAEGYWKSHSAVPKQIFFQQGENGKLELIAFRATGRGGEGRAEYWDVNDASYDGIPLKQKIPGDPMGRYRLMVFRPKATARSDADRKDQLLDLQIEREQFERDNQDPDGYTTPDDRRHLASLDRRMRELREGDAGASPDGVVPGTFEDATPGKIYKGSRFADGKSQVWVVNPVKVNHRGDYDENLADRMRSDPEYRRLNEAFANGRGDGDAVLARGREIKEAFDKEWNSGSEPVLAEETERTTKDGISTLVTKKYPAGDKALGMYLGDENVDMTKPTEIVTSRVVNPELMRQMGYNPDVEADVRRFRKEVRVEGGGGWAAPMARITEKIARPGHGDQPDVWAYNPRESTVALEFTDQKGRRYRRESFPSGPKGEDSTNIFVAMNDSRDLSIQPKDTFDDIDLRPLRLEGFRLTDITDGQPVLNHEVSWDEGLGSFVWTSGNRRWRIGDDPVLDPEGKTLWDQYQKAQRAHANADFSLASGRERMNYYVRLNITRRSWESWAREHSVSEGDPTRRILVEDRQPDGTWAPARDVLPNANGGTTSLPPPPPAIRMADTQVERRLMTDEADPAFLGLAPGEDAAWQRMEEGRAVPAPAPVFGGDHGYDGDVFDGEVPFALKAGRTRRNVRAAEGGGDTSGAPGASVPPSAPAQSGGPRIVINPQVFTDKRDALCVAFNEAFRLVMEENGFEPVSEPTEEQRKFFSDTAYANDELQLRRTILARIATLDTSVKDPTDEQLEETAEMLEMVMEVGAPQNEWEQSAVQRLHDVVVKMRESPRSPSQAASTGEPAEPIPSQESEV